MTRQRRKSARAVVTFLRERVALSQGISLQKLTGHLSQLPPDLRTKYASSVKSLTAFLEQYPDVFVICNQDVYLTTERPSPSGSLESVPSSMSGRVPKASTEQMKGSEFKNLHSVNGVVCRIINTFGFVTVTDPIQTSVYFDVKVFEGGKHKSLPASGLNVGDEVILDANTGPLGCKAGFRATHVKRTEATIATSSSQAVRAVRCPFNHLPMHSGLIENVKNEFGFIKFGRKQRDRAFFHLDKVDNPNRRKVGKLAEIVTIDDQVLFKAVPSRMPKGNVKFEAVVVYVPHFSTEHVLDDPADDSGNEVFMSDDESDIEELIRGDDTSGNDYQEAEVGFPDWETGSASGVVEAFQPKANESFATSAAVIWEELRKVSGKKGILVPKTDEHGEIKFGSEVVHASVDVTYRGREPVVSMQFELQDNTEVSFDAVESADGKWIATLVWTDDRPPSKPSIEESEAVFRDQITSVLRPVNASPPDSEGDRLELLLAENVTAASGMVSPVSRMCRTSVTVNKDARAIVTLAMECVIQCEVEQRGRPGRPRMVEVTTFYKDGVIYVDDVNKVLKVGDTVTLDYMVATVGNREEVYCGQVWQGRRPDGLPELDPEEFCQRLGIDPAAQEGIPSFEDFEREM